MTAEHTSDSLVQAIYDKKHNDVVSLLQERVDVNAISTRGLTALTAAVFSQYADIPSLLKAGGDINNPDLTGSTAVSYAMMVDQAYHGGVPTKLGELLSYPHSVETLGKTLDFVTKSGYDKADGGYEKAAYDTITEKLAAATSRQSEVAPSVSAAMAATPGAGTPLSVSEAKEGALEGPTRPRAGSPGLGI